MCKKGLGHMCEEYNNEDLQVFLVLRQHQSSIQVQSIWSFIDFMP
jgi:hypothetical protein